MSDFSEEYGDDFAKVRSDLKRYDPVPGVVRLAEMILAEAKAGRFVELAVAAVKHDHHHKHAFEGGEKVRRAISELQTYYDQRHEAK